MGLQDSVVWPSYGRRYEGAWERVCERCSGGRERGSLAGHIEACSRPESRGQEILRAVLRPALRPVLRAIFRAALRNREVRVVERAGKRVRTPR